MEQVDDPHEAGDGPGYEDQPHRHVSQLGSLVPAKLGEFDTPVKNNPRENQHEKLGQEKHDTAGLGREFWQKIHIKVHSLTNAYGGANHDEPDKEETGEKEDG